MMSEIAAQSTSSIASLLEAAAPSTATASARERMGDSFMFSKRPGQQSQNKKKKAAEDGEEDNKEINSNLPILRSAKEMERLIESNRSSKLQLSRQCVDETTTTTTEAEDTSEMGLPEFAQYVRSELADSSLGDGSHDDDDDSNSGAAAAHATHYFVREILRDVVPPTPRAVPIMQKDGEVRW